MSEWVDPGDQNVHKPAKDSDDPAQGGLFEVVEVPGIIPSYSTKEMHVVDLSLPYQPHSETSKAAADSQPSTKVERDRRLILDYLSVRGPGDMVYGATDEEMQHDLQMPANTQRPRRVELVKAGLIKDSGRTRKTQSGRAATVWVKV